MLTKEQIEQNKNEFISIYKQCVQREGADAFLDYLAKTDFFSAPASTRFHGAYEGGLCFHSLNVYKRLKELVALEPKIKVSEETIAICGLLHDVCKTGYYKVDMRNRKVDGVWVQEPYYTVEDALPYGHGEKSVYIINGFMRLSREEAIAVNWHMGWSDPRTQNSSTLDSAYNKFPFASLLHNADVMATYIDENRDI